MLPLDSAPKISVTGAPPPGRGRAAALRRPIGGSASVGNHGPRNASQALSLREESSGRTRVDEPSLLRVKHLQRLAAWAGAEAGVSPVGALLGRRLAASAEAAGVPLGATTFLCQRCETVLKAGFNCTVRVKNKRNKAKRRKKSNCCQNGVAYACHFCGDQNLILGSGKGVVKNLLSSREQGSVDCMQKILRGNNNIKGVLEHCQAASLQVDYPGSRQATSERGGHGERLKHSLQRDCKTDKVPVLLMEPCLSAASSLQEDSINKSMLESINDEHIHVTEPIPYKEVEICETNVTSISELPVGSKFVTPQKTKPLELTHQIDSAESFKTRSKVNKKGENSGSVTLASSSMSSPDDSQRKTKSAIGNSAEVSGSTRKRTRKGWTTLKQIAEKADLERKEKMDNFVIPFFMQ